MTPGLVWSTVSCEGKVSSLCEFGSDLLSVYRKVVPPDPVRKVPVLTLLSFLRTCVTRECHRTVTLSPFLQLTSDVADVKVPRHPYVSR